MRRLPRHLAQHRISGMGACANVRRPWLRLHQLTRRALAGAQLADRDDEACSICLERFAKSDELLELVCSHRFHRPCISRWILGGASGCPLRCPAPSAHAGGEVKDVQDPDMLSDTSQTTGGEEGLPVPVSADLGALSLQMVASNDGGGGFASDYFTAV